MKKGRRQHTLNYTILVKIDLAILILEKVISLDKILTRVMKFVLVDSCAACLKTKKVWLKGMVKITTQDCDYFVDAQLHHAWEAGSVPIVMATGKLDEFLPGPYLNHSVIKARDFKSPQLLADYIKHLSNNEAEYNKYLEWKWKGYGDITGTAIGNYWMPKYPMYCQVCVALSEERQHKQCKAF